MRCFPPEERSLLKESLFGHQGEISEMHWLLFNHHIGSFPFVKATIERSGDVDILSIV